MSLIRKLIEKNKKLSYDFLKKHPLENMGIRDRYVKIIRNRIKDGFIVYDIGGGKHCQYAEGLDRENLRIIALDISDEELSENSLVSEKIVTDVCEDIPIPYGQVDMITSSSVLEHLTDTEAFFQNACKSLKKGGYFIHLCPCRYAPFAVINRLLPNRISRKILFFFHPDSKGKCGFPAYYNDTYYSAVRKLLKENGFEFAGCYFRYCQCDYFSFFFPLFLLNYAWDRIMKTFGLHNMASHMIFAARKK